MATVHFHSLSEMFLKTVEKHDKAPCFLFKSDGKYQSISSREVLRQVAAVASVLSRLGIAREDRVAMISENRLEWALTDYAILGLGAITVPIYPTLVQSDVEYILRDSGAKGVVVSTREQLQKVLNVRDRLGELRFVLVMECDDLQENGVKCWKEAVNKEMRDNADAATSFSQCALEVKAEDVASILYTSGTMGQPKGVILTHSNIVSNIHSCETIFPLGPDDVAMSFLPLSHIFERTLDYLSFWRGVSIAYAESFDKLPQNLREVCPTMMAVVPRVLEKVHGRTMQAVHQAPPWRRGLFHWAVKVGKEYFPFPLKGRKPPLGLRLRYALADALALSKVRALLGGRIQKLFSGAAPLSRELAEFFYALGMPVYEGYGLTETSPVISVNYPGHVKLGTVGQVIPGVEVRLADEADESERGDGREILVRGPSVTSGYYRLDAENREAFVGGWFRTGDLGTLDSEGYLSVTGRKKNLFKTSGGKYVSPEKLENLFQGHPLIHQIMVVGDARKFVGALIVPNFDRLEAYAREHRITFETREELVANPKVLSFMQEQVDEMTRELPPHEKIRQVALVPCEFSIDSGELSATLKIRRRVVEDRYEHLIEEIFRRPAPQAQAKSAVYS